jgi:hypothetical protein
MMLGKARCKGTDVKDQKLGEFSTIPISLSYQKAVSQKVNVIVFLNSCPPQRERTFSVTDLSQAAKKEQGSMPAGGQAFGRISRSLV